MAKGVNYWNGGQWSEVPTVQDGGGTERPVYRWDGSQWVKIFPSLPVAPSSLIAWYKLDSGSGTTAVDSADTSDFGNSTSEDGTISGASWNPNAKTGGQALDLDGTDDGVDLPNLGLSGDAAYTVAGWIYFDDLSTSRAFLRWGDRTSQKQLLIYGNGSTLNLNHWNDNYDANVSLSTGQWYHIALVYDGSIDTLYVDGSQDRTYDPAALSLADNQYSLGYSVEENDYYHDGRLDDVRFYDSALSASQVSDIYNNTK